MTNVMPSGAVDTFTGANGTSVAGTNWVISKNDGTGAATIQSNACRIRTGTTSGNRTSIRVNMADRADTEIDFIWTVPTAGTEYPYAYLRADTLIDTNNGYYFSLEAGDMIAGVSSGYSGTDLQTYTHGFTAGQVVHTRIAVFGNRCRARTWLQSNSEPTSTWQIDFTDSTWTTGRIGVTTVSASAGAKDLIIDSFNATDTLTPSAATLLATGGITPAGVLLKSPAKKFTGAITPTGALTKIRVVTRVFTGAITPAGALAKSAVKRLAGTIAPTGTMRKVVPKTFTGSITPAATIRKTPVKKFAGAITPSGAAVMMFVGRIFGRPGLAVMRLVENGTVRIRHRRGG